MLVYCPKKKSVEASAEAYLKANRQGYFPSVLDPSQRGALANAIRIGTEWLGHEHPAVSCLMLGIAVHHGSLPRPFLSAVETLLRQRILPVCICSPTLAQGLDLSFSVLLLRSLYRNRDKPIPATEFANVVGRVGRAFVDLDGLYVLPVFEKGQTFKRFRQFRQLIHQAQQRQLESGVRILVGNIIQALQSRLGGDPNALREYVLNMSSTWEVAEQEGVPWHEWIPTWLNELDLAILSAVDVLDLPTDELAAYLDQCLQSSYWQRRLQREPLETRELHEHIIRGRARWLWSRTTTQRRRAFFAAGVGFAAGTLIDQQLDDIGGHLRAAEFGLAAGDLNTAIGSAVALADILFDLGPFQPDGNIEGWKDLLGHWLQGTPLGVCTDNEGVKFIQDNIVYRLVWAVEAARLHLLHIQENADEPEPPGTTLALCLTYGVPSLGSALFMQAGLNSRVMATAVVNKVGTPIDSMEMLRGWVDMLRKKIIAPIEWDTGDERAEWRRFLRAFDHREIREWRDIEATIQVNWFVKPPLPKTRVRVTRVGSGPLGRVSSVTCVPLGEVAIPDEVHSNYFTGRVSDDQSSLIASFFGY